MHDELFTDRKLRVLTVVDTFSRYVPVLDARFRYRGEDVVATLDRVCGQIGYRKTIRVDQGSEFLFRGMDLWAYCNLDGTRRRHSRARRLENSRSRTPWRCLGRPLEAANAALFLASDDGPFLTGENFMVDGR